MEQPEPRPYYNRNRTRDGRLIEVRIDWNYLRDEAAERTAAVQERSQQASRLIAPVAIG